MLALVCLSPWAFGAADPAAGSRALCGRGGAAASCGLRGSRLRGRFAGRNVPCSCAWPPCFCWRSARSAELPRHVLARLSPGHGPDVPTVAAVAARNASAGEQAAAAASAGRLDRQSLSRRHAAGTPATAGGVLLFAVVRNNAVSAAALRRLCIAALVNGALLSLLGLIQFFTSPHNMVYWSVPTYGSVFGPFVNRNHFAFYANLCAGLGLGLLFAMKRTTPTVREQGGRICRFGKARPAGCWPVRRSAPSAAACSWIGAALALIASGVMLSLSRGGLVAFVGAAAVCAMLGLRRSSRSLDRRRGGRQRGHGAGLARVAGFGAGAGSLGDVVDGRVLSGRPLYFAAPRVAGGQDISPLWRRAAGLSATWNRRTSIGRKTSVGSMSTPITSTWKP